MTSSELVHVAAVSPAVAQVRHSTRASRPLSIHLTIHTLDQIARNLLPFYGEDCPVAVVYDDHGPATEIVQGTLATIGGWADAMTGRPLRVLVG